MKLAFQNTLFQKALIFILICIIFLSCKQDQQDLLGKWTGKPTGNCSESMFSYGITGANFEFLKDGICIHSLEGNDGEGEARVTLPDSKYEFTADSLILTSTENVYTRHAYKYEVKDKNNIVLTRSYTKQDNPATNCTTVTKLTRLNK